MLRNRSFDSKFHGEGGGNGDSVSGCGIIADVEFVENVDVLWPRKLDFKRAIDTRVEDSADSEF